MIGKNTLETMRQHRMYLKPLAWSAELVTIAIFMALCFHRSLALCGLGGLSLISHGYEYIDHTPSLFQPSINEFLAYYSLNTLRAHTVF